jgi:hypothetical protein
MGTFTGYMMAAALAVKADLYSSPAGYSSVSVRLPKSLAISLFSASQ